jgi:hypothetical protein
VRCSCGVTINYGAYQRELKKGAGAAEAWRKTKKGIANKKMRYGRWDGNRLVKEVRNNKDPKCKVADFRWANSSGPPLRLIEQNEPLLACPEWHAQAEGPQYMTFYSRWGEVGRGGHEAWLMFWLKEVALQ